MTDEDREYTTARNREGRTFWYSLLSALGVLAVLGIILYAAQANNPPNQGVEPGIGGGPGTVTSSPSPTPSPSPTTEVTPTSEPLTY